MRALLLLNKHVAMCTLEFCFECAGCKAHAYSSLGACLGTHSCPVLHAPVGECSQMHGFGADASRCARAQLLRSGRGVHLCPQLWTNVQRCAHAQPLEGVSRCTPSQVILHSSCCLCKTPWGSLERERFQSLSLLSWSRIPPNEGMRGSIY